MYPRENICRCTRFTVLSSARVRLHLTLWVCVLETCSMNCQKTSTQRAWRAWSSFWRSPCRKSRRRWVGHTEWASVSIALICVWEDAGEGFQDSVFFLWETISSEVRNIDVGVERAWILVLVLRPISPYVRPWSKISASPFSHVPCQLLPALLRGFKKIMYMRHEHRACIWQTVTVQ